MMRLKWIMLGIVCLVGINSHAQFTIGIQSGRHFPVLQREIQDGNSTTNDSIRIISLAKFSYGSGSDIGMFVEYKAKNGLSVGIDYSWFLGKPYSLVRKDQPRLSTEKHRGQAMRLSPYIQSHARLKEKLELCFSVGPVLYFANRVDIELESLSNNFGTTERLIRLRRYSQNIGIGGRLGLTVRYKYVETVQFSLGVKGLFLNYWPGQSKQLIYIRNDEDILATLTEQERITTYLTEVDANANFLNDGSQPRVSTKRSYPFSSLGVMFTVHYQLGRA